MNFIQKNANQSSINAFILDKVSEGKNIIERDDGFWAYRTPEELEKITVYYEGKKRRNPLSYQISQ